jgi:hypothetical protein
LSQEKDALFTLVNTALNPHITREYIFCFIEALSKPANYDYFKSNLSNPVVMKSLTDDITATLLNLWGVRMPELPDRLKVLLVTTTVNSMSILETVKSSIKPPLPVDNRSIAEAEINQMV